MDDNERFAAMDKQMKKSKEAEIRASERKKIKCQVCGKNFPTMCIECHNEKED